MKLTLAEEQKIATRPGYRTSARTLRKLASGHMIFEMLLPKEAARQGDWDRFEVRNVGLAIQRHMNIEFASDPQRIRSESTEFIKVMLGLKTKGWSVTELETLENFALVLAMHADTAQWTSEEKTLAGRIIRAKADGDERLYLKLMQQHAPLRALIVHLGSQSRT
jgi:hypothetical protein